MFHIDDIARLKSGTAGKSLYLPCGLHFSVGYTEAAITSLPEDFCSLPCLEGEYRLKVPGETLVQGWRVTAPIVPRKDWADSSLQNDTGYLECFDFESTGEQLWAHIKDGPSVLDMNEKARRLNATVH